MGGRGDLAPGAGDDDGFFGEVDFYSGYEGAVEAASGVVVGCRVRGSAGLHDAGGGVPCLLDVRGGHLALVAFAFGGLALAGDAVLFAAEQVEGDGVGVGHLDELAALFVELRDCCVGSDGAVDVVAFGGFQVEAQLGADDFGVERVEVDGVGPGAFEAGFEVLSLDVGEVAASSRMAFAADVVGDLVAGAAADEAVEHPRAAALAGEQTAQVMAVGALLDADLLTFVEDALHSVE